MLINNLNAIIHKYISIKIFYLFCIFTDICTRLRLDKEVDSLIDVMRTECYLLLKGPKLYQLLSA